MMTQLIEIQTDQYNAIQTPVQHTEYYLYLIFPTLYHITDLNCINKHNEITQEADQTVTDCWLLTADHFVCNLRLPRGCQHCWSAWAFGRNLRQHLLSLLQLHLHLRLHHQWWRGRGRRRFVWRHRLDQQTSKYREWCDNREWSSQVEVAASLCLSCPSFLSSLLPQSWEGEGEGPHLSFLTSLPVPRWELTTPLRFICSFFTWQVDGANWVWVVIFIPGQNGDYPSVCLPGSNVVTTPEVTSRRHVSVTIIVTLSSANNNKETFPSWSSWCILEHPWSAQFSLVVHWSISGPFLWPISLWTLAGLVQIKSR